MDYTPIPDQAYLRECLDYDPDTGNVIFRTRPRSHFKTLGGCRGWNKKFAGKQAGSGKFGKYARVMLSGTRFTLHRVIWKMMTGVDPVLTDHANRSKRDNRWVNLREATWAQNMVNVDSVKRSKTGYKGVRGIPSGRFIAVLGKPRTYLGVFDTAEAAYSAYEEAARRKWGEFWRPE